MTSVPTYAALIGETPIIDVTRLAGGQLKHPGTVVLAKCEFFNPGYSIKDRIAKHIIQSAMEDGSLIPGGTVVAASSGNTGAAVAMVCAQLRLQCIIITSPKCSEEKMDAIRAYGATLLVSPSSVPEGHPDHYMELEKRIVSSKKGWFSVNQYENHRNSESHYLTLGPEIWRQTQGEVTHFIAGGSTGGTVSGVGKALKEASDGAVTIIMCDPEGSVLAEAYEQYGNEASSTKTELKPSKFQVEGVGKGTVPGVLDFGVVDQAVSVSDQDAFDMCHRLGREEGILAGGSGGLNLFAALRLAKTAEGPGGKRAVIVTVLPDSGIKYLSKVFSSSWLQSNGFSAIGESDIDVPDEFKSMIRSG